MKISIIRIIGKVVIRYRLPAGCARGALLITRMPEAEEPVTNQLPQMRRTIFHSAILLHYRTVRYPRFGRVRKSPVLAIALKMSPANFTLLQRPLLQTNLLNSFFFKYILRNSLHLLYICIRISPFTPDQRVRNCPMCKTKFSCDEEIEIAYPFTHHL